jgi:hypothetical protein
MVSCRIHGFPVVWVDPPDQSKAHSPGRFASPYTPSWHQPSYGRNSPRRMHAFMVAGSAVPTIGSAHRSSFSLIRALGTTFSNNIDMMFSPSAPSHKRSIFV